VSGSDNHLNVSCDSCGANQSRPIDWLHDNTVLTCDHCGTAIDISRGAIRGDIQRAWNAAHDRGPLRRHLP
jgi:ribosomal protein S27E